MWFKGFPGGSDGIESARNVGYLGWKDSSGEGNVYLFQYSCLGNLMDRERSLVGYSP